MVELALNGFDCKARGLAERVRGLREPGRMHRLALPGGGPFLLVREIGLCPEDQ